MKPSPCVYWTTDWRDAVEEAVRRNRVCHEKFGNGPWVCRVRRRHLGRTLVWKVYLPWGRIPS